MPQESNTPNGTSNGPSRRGAATSDLPTGRVREINYEVGRTGRLTPVVTVTLDQPEGKAQERKVTLRGTLAVKGMDLRIGDAVSITRPGRGYRRIALHHKDRRTGRETVTRLPEKCPACNEWTTTPGDNAAPRCANTSCPERRAKELLHFLGPDGHKIPNAGIILCRKLTASGLVQNPEDALNLTETNLLVIQGLHARKAAALAHALRRAKSGTT